MRVLSLPWLCPYRRSELWLSSRKLARMAALSFCTTARSSAMVLEARTLRMNCFTVDVGRQLSWLVALIAALRHTGAHLGGGLKDPSAG